MTAQAKNRIGLLLVFMACLVSSCTANSYKPGDPQNEWLNGTWEGRTTTGLELRASLRIINGNEAVGEIKSFGGSNSAWRHVAYAWGKVAGLNVALNIKWPGGNVVLYNLTYETADQSLSNKGKSMYLKKTQISLNQIRERLYFSHDGDRKVSVPNEFDKQKNNDAAP